MERENAIAGWFFWHFYEMPVFLFSMWKNYIAFVLYYFSIPLLVSTLFSPWRRYNWGYPKYFSLGEYAGTFISNLFSRIIGAMARLVLIATGIVSMAAVLVLGMAVMLAWIILPFLLVWLPVIIFS